MTVYITKRNNGKYNYLLNWRNPENGVMFGDWFETMKELKEYISKWGATIEKNQFLSSPERCIGYGEL